MGGKECISSNEVFILFLAMAGRWLTKDSHKINKKNITDTKEIIDPNLATTFQNINLSG